MGAVITAYSGLTSAVAAWLARDGDIDLATRADDFIALCEQRLYLGADEIPNFNIPAHEAIRIPEMYQSNTSFAVSQSVAQPTGLLELIEVQLNSTDSDAPRPLTIVEESILDSMSPYDAGAPQYIALSGNNFRFWPDPGTSSYTATLRYYARLTTPSGTNSTNWILSNAPGVYLNGCLLEAALFTGDFDGAVKYAVLYGSAVAGLNIRGQRRLASGQNVRIKLRGATP